MTQCESEHTILSMMYQCQLLLIGDDLSSDRDSVCTKRQCFRSMPRGKYIYLDDQSRSATMSNERHTKVFNTTKPTTTMDAIDSSVGSLTSSFVQLNMNPYTINRLPPKLIQQIVAKLELDGDVNDLLHLRLVSTKWRAVIEGYCGLKRSLFVVIGRKLSDEAVFDAAAHNKHVKNNFFGIGKFKDFARLALIPQLSSQCLKSFLNLFPNIVQLSIRCSDRTRNLDFIAYINSLASLTQLDLVGLFSPDLFNSQSVSTLSKLDHFSICSIYPKHSLKSSSSINQIISKLGRDCFRFKFDFFAPSDFDAFFQLHNNVLISRQWLINLTHLAVRFERTSGGYDRVLAYLDKHAIFLKYLSFEIRGESLKLSLDEIGNLAKLTLPELDLRNISFDVSELDKEAAERRLTRLSSVLRCQLHVYAYGEGFFTLSAEQFARCLSIIFPNLVELDVTIYTSFDASDWQYPREVGQLLNRLPKLRKHKIVVL